MEQADFLVIGGGIAGVSAGARLAELGRVVLLEAEDALATQASGRSAALFEARYGHPHSVALNEASFDEHRSLGGGLLSPRGLMVVGGPGEEDAVAEDAARMGLDSLSPAEAAARVPILDTAHVTRAAFHDAAWDLDTDRMLQTYTRALRAAGGRILTGAGVGAIRRVATGWQVEAGGMTHAARVLVNAAGAWADRVAQMAGLAPLGLRPLRRSMARLAAPGGHDTRGWPMLIGAGERWYAKPDAGAWLVSPAEEDPVDAPHDAWADDLVLAEGLARYQDYVTAPVTRPIATWAGLRTFAPDRAMVLGFDPTAPWFLWVAGQGGSGFQTAPAASRLVADLAAGRRPPFPDAMLQALSPARLR